MLLWKQELDYPRRNQIQKIGFREIRNSNRNKPKLAEQMFVRISGYKQLFQHFFKTCIARFSLRRGEVWIQGLNHEATTTKQAKKAANLENKENKLRRRRAPRPDKPTQPHPQLHPVGLGHQLGLHKYHDGEASAKRTGGQASTRGPSLQPQTTSPIRIRTLPELNRRQRIRQEPSG
jgi:hypothetical protein